MSNESVGNTPAEIEEFARVQVRAWGHKLGDFAPLDAAGKEREARCRKCDEVVHYEVARPRATVTGEPFFHKCTG